MFEALLRPVNMYSVAFRLPWLPAIASLISLDLPAGGASAAQLEVMFHVEHS
jgi:hypothetical protein